jgi:fatty acid desaturase
MTENLKKNFNKLKTEPILVLFVVLVTLSAFQIYIVSQFGNINWLINTLLILSSTIILHYYFNILHIGSHYGISNNKTLNSFVSTVSAAISGHTYACFATTHSIHHQFPGNEEKDPDYKITHGSFFLFLPFKIFRHDLWFFEKNLYKKSGKLNNYLITRIIQIILISAIVLSGNLDLFLLFWLFPIYILGVLNGIFLFYLPHNVTKYEKILSKLSNVKLLASVINLFENIIFISRISHESHHNNVKAKDPYFPVIYYFINNVKYTKDYRFKYIN